MRDASAPPTAGMTFEEAMGLARSRQGAGALEEARAIYEHILRLAPDQPDALTMLASIGFQRGDDAAATGRVDAAIAAYRRMLLDAPDNHALRGALANLLLARDRRAEAEAVIARATLAFNPVRASRQEFDRRRRQGRARGLPGILINALPKSASESIWNKLAEGLGLAQGHISLGLFPDCLVIPYRARELGRGGMAAKEHLPATRHNLAALARAGVVRMIVQLRDPRQATLSWAHFLEGDVRKRLLAPLWRKTSPAAAFFRKPFADQLDWHIDNYLPLALRFIESWAEASERRPHGLAVKLLAFETFKADPDAYFDALLDFYGIDRDLFRRDAEAEIVHLRKGAVDEWRQVFSPEQAARAWERIPPALARRFDWAP
ncbi:MAG: tetratricopeptide repeat protein [Alphaproteobacteria bacterium]